jgi:hypothetical protein
MTSPPLDALGMISKSLDVFSAANIVPHMTILIIILPIVMINFFIKYINK